MGFFKTSTKIVTRKRRAIVKRTPTTRKPVKQPLQVVKTKLPKKIRSVKYIPKLHQKRAIANLVKHKHYGLLLAPGRGKTGIVLEAFKQLKKKNKVDMLVVFAKKKIIMSTWPREMEKWGFPYPYHIAHGANKSIDAEDVILINYEGIGWYEDEMLRTKLHKRKRIMCVADESSRIKNSNTQRFSSIKTLAPLFDRRVILTGSPVSKNLIDLFAQIYFLDLGKSLGKFKTHYIANHFTTNKIVMETPGGKDLRFEVFNLMRGHDKKIFNKVKHLVMRLGEDSKLPPLTIVDQPVVLPPDAKIILKELEAEFISYIEDGIVTAANAGVLSMRLRQLSGGTLYDVDKRPVYVHTEKIDALEDIIDELQGSPCLVGYHFKPERTLIAKRFKQAVFFDSKLKSKDAIELENEWNAGNIEMLVGQTTTIAHGLNLQESGHHLVLYTPPPSLEDYEQLIKRLHREGQRNPVTVIRLLAEGTIDYRVIASLESKDKQQRNFLQIFEDYYEGKYR